MAYVTVKWKTHTRWANGPRVQNFPACRRSTSRWVTPTTNLSRRWKQTLAQWKLSLSCLSFLPELNRHQWDTGLLKALIWLTRFEEQLIFWRVFGRLIVCASLLWLRKGCRLQSAVSYECCSLSLTDSHETEIAAGQWKLLRDEEGWTSNPLKICNECLIDRLTPIQAFWHKTSVYSAS